MTTAVCYFSYFDLSKHQNPSKFVKSLEKTIKDLYSHYKKVYYGRLPGTNIYYISTATQQEVMKFFEY